MIVLCTSEQGGLFFRFIMILSAAGVVMTGAVACTSSATAPIQGAQAAEPAKEGLATLQLSVPTEKEISELKTEWTDNETGERIVFHVELRHLRGGRPAGKFAYLIERINKQIEEGHVAFRITCHMTAEKINADKKEGPKQVLSPAGPVLGLLIPVGVLISDSENNVVTHSEYPLARLCYRCAGSGGTFSEVPKGGVYTFLVWTEYKGVKFGQRLTREMIHNDELNRRRGEVLKAREDAEKKCEVAVQEATEARKASDEELRAAKLRAEATKSEANARIKAADTKVREARAAALKAKGTEAFEEAEKARLEAEELLIAATLEAQAAVEEANKDVARAAEENKKVGAEAANKINASRAAASEARAKASRDLQTIITAGH